MTGRCRLGQLHHATIVCADLEWSSEFYRSLLGYVDVDANVGGSVPCASSGAHVTLGCPGETSGFVRLVGQPDTRARPPLTQRGWSTLEFIVADVEAVADHVTRLGDVTVITPPSRAGATGQLGVFHVIGPDGEILYLTQVLVRHDRYELPPTPTTLVGPLFIGVWATSSLDGDRRWFEQSFAVTRVSDRLARLRAVNWVRGRPANAEYRISSLDTGARTLIEIDEVDDLAPASVAGRGPALAGVSAITFSPIDGASFVTVTSDRRCVTHDHCDYQS